MASTDASLPLGTTTIWQQKTPAEVSAGRQRAAVLHSARSRLGARRAAGMATIGTLVRGYHRQRWLRASPFYEQLHAQRLDVAPWESAASS